MPSWIDALVHRSDARLLDPSQPPRRPTPSSPHAVVIGAGFGGLASAVRLLARGFRVTVVDRLDQAGGRARVFRENGYAFDAGPTVVTAPFLLDELWQLAGKDRADDVELREVTPFYRIRFDDGTHFDYTGDREAMHAQIRQFSPEDVEGYDRFFEKTKDIFHVGFEELAHVPFTRVVDMLRLIPAMAWLESHRTVYGFVSKFVKHEKLRKVLSFHPLLVGGNPFNVTSIYTMIAFLERKWGVWYAMGGTGALVNGLVGLIEEMSGQVRLGADVEQILINGKRAAGVRLAGGEVIDADLVVSNADVAWTYKHLVPPNARKVWTDAKIERTRYSMSLFVWYFGTNRQYPDVKHHTILLGTRYKELLDDIFGHRLADDFSLYLHRPTATDPSMAPDGCDAFYVLSPVPHLDSGDEWDDEQVERYRKGVERYLEESILPGLSEHLDASVTLTPKGFLEDYKSYKGAAFSIEPVLLQSAYFRPHNVSEDVEHLYFAGAGTHPGAGMPGVISSARVLDTVVPDADTFRTVVPANAL
jgi:phytoene desaturase